MTMTAQPDANAPDANAADGDRARRWDAAAWLTEIVRELVDDPEAVRVTATRSESSVLVSVRVADGDLGKLIGRQGKNVGALRTLLSAAARKYHARAMLEVVEPGRR